MTKIVSGLVKLLLLVLCGSVALADEPAMWMGICRIGALDRISDVHIGNFLSAHNIRSRIWGSLLYVVEVPRENVDEAIRLLTEDAKARKYTFILGENKVVGANPGAKVLLSQIPIGTVLRQPAFLAKTALGRFFRSEEIAKLTKKYPTVQSLDVLERLYLSSPNHLSKAYEVRLDLRGLGKKSEEGCSFCYQILANGRYIESLGGQGNASPD